MAAFTVVEYLAALPADRRAALSAVRKVINENLPDGYEEGIQFGMIGWYVPLSVYPAGYGENPKVPLPLVALASQKSGMVLHFMSFYGHPTLRDWFISEWSKWERATSTEKPRGSGERVGRRANQYKKSGKKLDMGKGCVRFKSLEHLALDVVGRTVARVSVEEHMANYRAARALLGKGNSELRNSSRARRVRERERKKRAPGSPR
ncbi:MAG: DUF1801 domain-containing protein [Chthoniobacterales bacterium]